jgi:hypothetical protein
VLPDCPQDLESQTPAPEDTWKRVAELLQNTKVQAKHSLYLASTELPRITGQDEQAQITQRAQWGSPWDAISQSKWAKLRAKNSQRKVCQLMLGMLPYS